MHELDTLGKELAGCEEFAALNQCEEAAYDLILGNARQLFELSGKRTPSAIATGAAPSASPV